jgi:hypothetical protein
MRCILAILALLVLLTAPAHARPLLGVTDNEWTDGWARDVAKRMGLEAVRVFVFWDGEREPRPNQLALVHAAGSTGARVFVTVTQRYRDDLVPRGSLQDDYAVFVRSLAEQTGVRDVIVWNEPNLEGFWGGPIDPQTYASLLARTYDAVADLDVRIWAFALERSQHTIAFIDGVSAWVRESGRNAPIFYGVSHHPYPVAGDAWDARHDGTSTFTIGDTKQFLRTLDEAFAGTPVCPRLVKKRCSFPLIYGEMGWATQAMHIGRVSADEQAANWRQAYEYLSRFARVHAVFNFELRDSDKWFTGLFTDSGVPKPLARFFGLSSAVIAATGPAPPIPGIPLIGPEGVLG